MYTRAVVGMVDGQRVATLSDSPDTSHVLVGAGNIGVAQERQVAILGIASGTRSELLRTRL